MTDELREAYYQTFRTTDARCMVDYDTLEANMEAAGVDDEFCNNFINSVTEWGDKMQAKVDAAKKLCQGKSEEETAAIMQPLVDEMQATMPQLPADKMTVFQTNFLNSIKAEADLILLNTL